MQHYGFGPTCGYGEMCRPEWTGSPVVLRVPARAQNHNRSSMQNGYPGGMKW